MDTRGLTAAQYDGVAVDSGLESALGLPAVPAQIRDLFCRAQHTQGGGFVRTTLFMGDISDPNLPNLAITDKRRNGLKPLPLSIIEGTSGGYGAVKLLAFPKAMVEFGNVVCRLMGTSGGAATGFDGTSVSGTLTGTFQGSFAVGSTAIGSYITPTSTLANLLTSATIVKGVASVSGSTTAPGLSNRNTATLTGLLDNSGGTASSTIATFVTGATITPTSQNAIASLAAQINNLMKAITGSDTIGGAGGVVSTRRTLDGTTTANEVWYNSVVVDDSTAAGILYLEGRIIIDWHYLSAVPVTPTQYRVEGQG